jgi:hypothetical protein
MSSLSLRYMKVNQVSCNSIHVVEEAAFRGEWKNADNRSTTRILEISDPDSSKISLDMYPERIE